MNSSRFVREHDGAPERLLKRQLVEAFEKCAVVPRAFSSAGPTYEGFVKTDVVAPGPQHGAYYVPDNTGDRVGADGRPWNNAFAKNQEYLWNNGYL